MTGPSHGPWITFHCAGHEYALDVHDVVEVLSARRTTPLPGAHERLAGIVSWRGRTIPVLDLASFLKGPPAGPECMRRMLVLRHPEPFAIRVDAPGRLIGGPDFEAVAAKSTASGPEGSEDGMQMIRWEGGIVRLLDPRRILGAGPLLAHAGSSEVDE